MQRLFLSLTFMLLVQIAFSQSILNGFSKVSTGTHSNTYKKSNYVLLSENSLWSYTGNSDDIHAVADHVYSGHDYTITNDNLIVSTGKENGYFYYSVFCYPNTYRLTSKVNNKTFSDYSKKLVANIRTYKQKSNKLPF